MRKFVVLIKFQAIAVTSAATSILSLSAVLGLPALAQETEADTQETSNPGGQTGDVSLALH